MTDYRVIHGVKKRNFTVHAKVELSTTPFDIDYPTEILWDDGTEILWDDLTTIQWSNITSVYPRVIHAKKRSFRVRGAVNHE